MYSLLCFFSDKTCLCISIIHSPLSCFLQLAIKTSGSLSVLDVPLSSPSTCFVVSTRFPSVLDCYLLIALFELICCEGFQWFDTEGLERAVKTQLYRMVDKNNELQSQLLILSGNSSSADIMSISKTTIFDNLMCRYAEGHMTNV